MKRETHLTEGGLSVTGSPTVKSRKRYHRTPADVGVWDEVNWDLPNLAISQIHGISHYGIGQERKKRRHPARWDGRGSLHGDMDLLAALQGELAKKRMRSNPPPAVKRLVHRINSPTPHSRVLRRTSATTVDWTKRDCEIARLMGCTRERVRQIRGMLGKPPSSQIEREDRARARELATRNVTEVVRNAPTDAALTLAALSKQTGVQKWRIGAICRENDIDLRRFRKRACKYDYRQINWDLPNFALARIYPLMGKAVGTLRRQYGHPARWNGRYMNRSCPEFQKACRLERKKVPRLGR